jgi:uncharacterized membrane protein HdeD (DUF308 family)
VTSLWIKLIACPVIVIFGMYLFDNVNYAAFYQPVVLGIILALLGVSMEYVLLKKGTFWFSIVADFVASVLIVFFISNLFTNADVTLFGAILVAILLTISEYFTHRYLIKSEKTKKSYA